ncbi:MAG: hypothetical protein ACI4MP_05090 [Candidatus Ventricola sp.]
MRKENRRLAALGALLCASLGVTLALLVLEGRWQEAIPLHLCSLSALAAIALAFSSRQALLDFLWYLGMPGAALALAFPAPAASRLQALLNASYVVTHALILVIPALCMARGMRPRKGKSLSMMGALLAAAAVAGAVNRQLGTDFLFLAAPPAGTPLEAVFAAGYAVYLLFLFAMMLSLCLIMDALAGKTIKTGMMPAASPTKC